MLTKPFSDATRPDDFRPSSGHPSQFSSYWGTVTIRSVGSHRLREKARRLLWDRGRA